MALLYFISLKRSEFLAGVTLSTGGHAEVCRGVLDGKTIFPINELGIVAF